MDKKNITLIIPCYNEIANIQKGVLDKIGNYTKSHHRFSRILVCDDGSTDQSKKTIKEKYLPLFPKYRLIKNKHQGKAYAILSGIANTHTEYIFFIDLDLATPIEEVEKMIKALDEGYDVVIGSRSRSRAGAPFLRKIMSADNALIKNLLLGLHGIKDSQCGFKAFTESAAKNIVKRLKVFSPDRQTKGSSVSAGFDLEFLFIAKNLKYKIKEIPVMWRHVETKNVNFFKDSYEALKDIILIKYNALTNKYYV